MKITVNIEKEELLAAVSMMNLTGKMDDEMSEAVKNAVNEFAEDELLIEEKDFKLAVLFAALSEICRRKDEETDKRPSE